MVVLVTGGQGQVGQALQAQAQKHPEVQFYFASSAEADVTSADSLESIFTKVQPDFCINASAYTAVDKAESEQDKAYAINVTGAKNLAEACKKHNAVLVHISTDFVFDGNSTKPYTEDDITNPQGVYGATKRDGEMAIANVFSNYIIVRTSWVYSEFGNNFMKTMLRLASERDALNVVNDQIGTPTNANYLAQAILDIIQHIASHPGFNAFGIYNYSGEGECTWYGFAKKIFEVNNVKINLQPILSHAFPTPAKRPVYSVLDKQKIKTVFGLAIPDWEESLKPL
ncbi:dTDP-4-dehydrorhamnose reductase [Flavobacterium zepuense]|uniref:dTDP-4-dehydrorhamnose reductase n=1 Tax=Flavobacterium zepuense TaxID=2593302 RepID=A0A552UV96_9FLAO|nr:dTDP-4-dehydrorhamnose reductase [Flavobacterium zepuense]TRW22154.1 dTDP-4-dehydrorhamnose reductase [Flavobacterium zepuense]